MKPAVQTALAWTIISGAMRKGIHMDTYTAVNENLEFLPLKYRGTGRFFFEFSGTDPAYKLCDLWLTHAALIKAGFQSRGQEMRGRRRGQAYLQYNLLDEETGIGWRVWVDHSGHAFFDRVTREKVKSMVYSWSSKLAGTLPSVDWRA